MDIFAEEREEETSGPSLDADTDVCGVFRFMGEGLRPNKSEMLGLGEGLGA